MKENRFALCVGCRGICFVARDRERKKLALSRVAEEKKSVLLQAAGASKLALLRAAEMKFLF